MSNAAKQITTTKPAEANKRLKLTKVAQQQAAAASGNKILTLSVKKNNKSFGGGVYFLNASFNVGDGQTSSDCFFEFKDAAVRDMPDPSNKTDKRNIVNNATHGSISTTKSALGGSGEFMHKIYNDFSDGFNTLVNSKAIEVIKPGVAGNFKTEGITNEQNPDGVNYADPLVNMRISWEKFPETFMYKFLQDQPKTRFYDASRPWPDKPAGMLGPKYHDAQVLNPKTNKLEAINDKNVHLLIKKSTYIKWGILYVCGPSYGSKEYVASLPFTLIEAVIEYKDTTGFDYGSEEETKPTVEPVKVKVNSTQHNDEPEVTGFDMDEDVDATTDTSKVTDEELKDVMRQMQI
jgi:hypothetical protein